LTHRATLKRIVSGAKKKTQKFRSGGFMGRKGTAEVFVGRNFGPRGEELTIRNA